MIHSQVVLCPNINDGEILRRTIDDLAADFPRITSVAIVPLGLTRYNTDPRLTPVTPEFCRRIIDEVTKIQKQLRQRLGTTFAFLGDEIYLRAGRAVPGRAHYGNYPQIEDGIGMVRSFDHDFNNLLQRLERRPLKHAGKVFGTVLTGTLFAPELSRMVDKLNSTFGTRLQIEAVENKYFGGDVSVAGLLTGGDFLAARGQVRGDFVVVPKHTLKSDEEIMLDGMTLESLRAEIGLPIYPADLDSFAGMLYRQGQ